MFLRFFALLALFCNLLFGVVNINTADAKELSSLKGIGTVKAEAIIEWRNANGSFKSIDELTQVKGIGEKTLEAIKDEISVEDKSDK
ncbi:MAG: helix-hairpin-helix domain-containing protein [Helicobacteraceae bacterium]|jgi:competence protein ComEA|nr:helix-hairpin-helix domain-containing protein [Helicobacteraceae bacterium]